MNLGDILLYSALGLALTTTSMLLRYKEEHARYVRMGIRTIALLLSLALVLLTYYFATSNFTVNYVWSFSSKYHPLIYKLSGVLAGQQGTLLFWSLLIALGSLWLLERAGLTPFTRKAQVIVLILCAYFIALTLADSPFLTIYQLLPEVPKTFLPSDGAGLNPLLLDPWMALHPGLIFIGYAGLTVPYAVALVYLYESRGGETREMHKAWTSNALFWSRIAWLFLTIGISVGGVWAYKVLGWGGFWAWDPVETASYIPWVLLTGAIHAFAEHRADRTKYTILTPTLFAVSFSLVIYATLVTRSGFFESVHAFSAGRPGFYLVLLASAATLVPLGLAAAKYLKSGNGDEERPEEEGGLLNRTNIFYIAILLFILLTIIPFWGITFPAITRLATGNKLATGITFFNLWSFPFFIGLLLLAGFCINYRSATRERDLGELGLFAGLTLIAAMIKPSDGWRVVNYTAIVTPVKPLLYTFIGSASALSFVPPTVYLFYRTCDRVLERTKPLRDGRKRAKEVGNLLIHVGVVFVAVGAVFSSIFTTELSTSMDVDFRGITKIAGTPYSIKLVDYSESSDYGDEGAKAPGMSVSEFLKDVASGLPRESYTVHGLVAEVRNTEHNTYLRLTEGKDELWIAIDRAEVPNGVIVTTTGSLMLDFRSATMNRTFPFILFSGFVEPYNEMVRETLSTTQEVELAVFEGSDMIGRGTARSVAYKGGANVQKVLIDRGVLGDTYVIFSGLSGREVPLTLKIKPLINELWMGIILFIVGMLLILLSGKRKTG